MVIKGDKAISKVILSPAPLKNYFDLLLHLLLMKMSYDLEKLIYRLVLYEKYFWLAIHCNELQYLEYSSMIDISRKIFRASCCVIPLHENIRKVSSINNKMKIYLSILLSPN